MKNGLLLLFAVSCVSLAFSPMARSEDDVPPGFILFPSISILQEAGTLAESENVVSVDLRAGYRISSGWYFGMIYNNTSSGGTNTLNGSAIGNSLGYFYGIFSVIGSYHLSAQMSENTPLAYVQRSNGSGFQLDLGLTLPLGSDFYIGPVITFKDMTYGAETFAGSQQVGASQTQSFIYPFIGVYYRF